MFQNTKRGFTFVEVIIVVTILTILSTLAYTAYGKYLSNSRDTVRTVDMVNIKNGLSIFFANASKYPEPMSYVQVNINNTLVRNQGVMGERLLTVFGLANISNGSGKDPLTKTPYIYSTNAISNRYELALRFENTNSIAGITNSTYAALGNDIKLKGTGDSIGIFLREGNPIHELGIYNTTPLELLGNNTFFTSVFPEGEVEGNGDAIISQLGVRDSMITKLDDSLIGYWDMKSFVSNTDDTKLVEDLSKNDNHLFASGSLQFKDGYASDSSEFASGFRSAKLDTNLTINPYQNDYTFSAKVMTKTNYIQSLFTSRDTHSFHIYNSGGSFEFSPWKEGAKTVLIPSLNDRWLHYTYVTKKDGTTILYINGIKMSQVDIGNFSNGYAFLRIMNSRGSCFDCGSAGSVDKMDEVRIFNRAMTDSEINGLYMSQK